jgi:SagB-type dehydrogenase family enzyme
MTTTLGLCERYALRSGVLAVDLPDSRTRLLAPGNVETIGELRSTEAAALSALAQGGQSPDELSAAEQFVRRLDASGWLKRTVSWDDSPLYTLSPVRRPHPVAEPSRGELRLSRFAIVRPADSDGGVVVESPTAWCDVHIHSAAILAIVTGFDEATVELPTELVGRLRTDLCHAGLLVDGQAEQKFRTRQWSPHELVFHERSSINARTLAAPFGGTYWAEEHYESVPSRPDPFPGEPIPLPAADTARLRHDDATLTAVLEDRRSVRVHDDDSPLTVDQLGEFLHRCARGIPSSEQGGADWDRRPYPSGGGAYELEIYPVLPHVQGAEAAMYHYDTEAHALRPVCDLTAAGARLLLHSATAAAGITHPPQALLLISARVGRVMWKYEQMAYSLVLKHVGVLYQTMYCVATAMNLAPCALGAVHADGFAEASGRDPLVECAVGGFLLGSRA